MCQFFSAVATKDKLYVEYGVDSHSDIISINGLGHLEKDINRIGLVRLEITPNRPMTLDFGQWIFGVDQDILPDWFIADEWRQKMIDYLRGCRTIEEGESVQVEAGNVWFHLGEIKHLVGYGSILYMLGNSRVGKLYDNSRVGRLCNNSQVGTLYNNSQVRDLSDNSRVGTLYNNSQVGTLYNNSRVGTLYHNSRIIKDLRKQEIR